MCVSRNFLNWSKGVWERSSSLVSVGASSVILDVFFGGFGEVSGFNLFLLFSFSLTHIDCLCFSTFSRGALKGVGEGDLLEVEALG